MLGLEGESAPISSLSKSSRRASSSDFRGDTYKGPNTSFMSFPRSADLQPMKPKTWNQILEELLFMKLIYGIFQYIILHTQNNKERETRNFVSVIKCPFYACKKFILR